ncbi:MAG: hypothetical protein KDI48_15970 [Xanthomonadales bacterium]|nr:hypothetical protein [Xanthomonadales bacterium]
MAAHELRLALASAGLPLTEALVEMLDEHFSHCTERRGCGYTQATRVLAQITNKLAAWPMSATAERAEILSELLADSGTAELADERLPAVREQLERSESLLLLDWIDSLLHPRSLPLPAIALAPQRPKVGSCPLAEQYFLEIAHGRIRRGGLIRLWMANGLPVLLEKQGMGDDASAVTLRPAQMGGVALPVGTLLALEHPVDLAGTTSQNSDLNCRIVPLTLLDGAHVLRLTTLAVAPRDRKRAFGAHFQQQIDNGLYSPDTTEIGDLRSLADRLARDLG